jgi:hypothetical protein
MGRLEEMTPSEVNHAIKVAKRLTGKVPLSLKRYKVILEHLANWRRKAKLAETKIKKYSRYVKRYERRYRTKGDNK